MPNVVNGNLDKKAVDFNVVHNITDKFNNHFDNFELLNLKLLVSIELFVLKLQYLVRILVFQILFLN